jgi:hypothetical protein
MYLMIKFYLHFLDKLLLTYDYLLNVQHHDHFGYEYKVNDVICQYDQYQVHDEC